MKQIIKIALLGLCFAILTANQTKADLIISIEESGSDVVFNLSGNVNLNATMGYAGIAINGNQNIFPSVGAILMGNPLQSAGYRINTTWAPFGTGALGLFSSTNGDRVSLFAPPDPQIGVPIGYISGSPLSATGTFMGRNFGSLGITRGTYLTTFSNSGTGISDTVTVYAGVPEPCGLILCLTAGGFGLSVRRRRSL